MCGEVQQGLVDTVVTVDDNGGGHIVFQCVEKFSKDRLIRW